MDRQQTLDYLDTLDLSGEAQDLISETDSYVLWDWFKDLDKESDPAGYVDAFVMELNDFWED